jgi:hypothetical protein
MYPYSRLIVAVFALALTAHGTAAHAQVPRARAAEARSIAYAWQALPGSKVMLLVPEGWLLEYEQGTTTLASGSESRYYSPTERFAGALVQVFVSDAPRALGERFDLMRLAEDFLALQPVPTQQPALREEQGRQIVTVRYAGQTTKNQTMTYLAAFVVERQVLTVFLAATPEFTEAAYLPILEQMVSSIQLKPLVR